MPRPRPKYRLFLRRVVLPLVGSPQIAQQINETTKKAGFTILATGVNPGLVMDTLPITLTGACQQVNSIWIERHQNAAIRSLPFQEKIGADLAAQKIIRHVSFNESVQMIAARLGWKLDHTEDIVEPVVVENDVESQFLKVKKARQPVCARPAGGT